MLAFFATKIERAAGQMPGQVPGRIQLPSPNQGSPYNPNAPQHPGRYNPGAGGAPPGMRYCGQGDYYFPGSQLCCMGEVRPIISPPQ